MNLSLSKFYSKMIILRIFKIVEDQEIILFLNDVLNIMTTLMKNTDMREIQSISSDLHFVIPSGFIHFKYARNTLVKVP